MAKMTTYLLWAVSALILLIIGSIILTIWRAHAIEARYPNIGTLTDLGDMQMNALHIPAGPDADLPPIVFIHGASGNLRDQALAFRKPLEGRAELLFVDRPGHGYSERGGPQNDYPDGQAAAIAKLMDEKGIKRAIIVGHSFGGAIAASFAVLHPEKTAGLLFLSPATHPWPGGVAWYYHVATAPVIGPLFRYTVALNAGMSMLKPATVSVFSPNPMPDDYIDEAGPALVLRPSAFLANSADVVNLNDYVTRFSPRYKEIKTPTVIITGDSDDVVLANIHSKGLAHDIEGAQLLWIHNVGHKPDYAVTGLAIGAIESIAGKPRDLQTLAREAELEVQVTSQP